MKRIFSVMVVVSVFAASHAFGAGFALIEQSVKGLGTAFSGGSAVAEDASTIYYNPAGMTRLEGQQVLAAVHIIVPSSKLSATTAQNVLGMSLGTNNGGDAGEAGVAPNFYYVNRINDRVALGLGVNAPFGLSTKYDQDWVGRYQAVESNVITVNINPSIAYKVNDNLSIGVGVSAQYIDATLSSMVDGGLVAANLGGAAVPSDLANDIFVENKADDWSYGFNLGVLYELNKNTRFGAAYRSEVKHNLQGDTTTTVPAAIGSMTPPGLGGSIPLAALFLNQGVNGKIDLPASASLSVYHRFNEALALMADATWTGWSSFEKLTLNFEGSGIAGSSSTTTTENWDDTWRLSAGAAYNLSPQMVLRFGLAYDQTVIPSDEYRTPRIPDEDRYWVALGAGYQINDRWGIDGAYTHLFVADAALNKVDTGAPGNENTGKGTVVGTYEGSVDIASVQVSYSF
jgi:long-chain fatty acid transport protein